MGHDDVLPFLSLLVNVWLTVVVRPVNPSLVPHTTGLHICAVCFFCFTYVCDHWAGLLGMLR